MRRRGIVTCATAARVRHACTANPVSAAAAKTACRLTSVAARLQRARAHHLQYRQRCRSRRRCVSPQRSCLHRRFLSAAAALTQPSASVVARALQPSGVVPVPSAPDGEGVLIAALPTHLQGHGRLSCRNCSRAPCWRARSNVGLDAEWHCAAPVVLLQAGDNFMGRTARRTTCSDGFGRGHVCMRLDQRDLWLNVCTGEVQLILHWFAQVPARLHAVPCVALPRRGRKWDPSAVLVNYTPRSASVHGSRARAGRRPSPAPSAPSISASLHDSLHNYP